MKKDYTFKILKYLYKELSLTDHLETEYAIHENEEWKGEYDQLSGAIGMLPKISFYPKRAILKNIMNYSATSPA